MEREAREAAAARDRVEIVRQIERFAREGASRDYELGAWLLAAAETGAWVLRNCASVFEYAERVLGWDPRTTGSRLRVARALETLPATAEKLRRGELHWSAVRELTRVATPENEVVWLASASGKTVRDLEGLVAGKRRGALPDDPPDPDLLRYPVHLETQSVGFARWREAVAKAREKNPRMREEELFEEMVLLWHERNAAGDQAEGEETGLRAARPSYQSALLICPICKCGVMHGGGEAVPVPPHVVEQALCDGSCIGWANPADAALATGGVTAPFPPHVQKQIDGTAKQATRSIPPTTATRVWFRDRGRCQVPGCRNTLWLNVHHILPWSEGGTHADENLLLLCSTHHSQQHEGRLWIDGTAPDRLRFLAADGSSFGTLADAARLAVYQAAHEALRRTGLGERRTREVLTAARQLFEKAGTEPSEVELVTEALRQHKRGQVSPPREGRRTHVGPEPEG